MPPALKPAYLIHGDDHGGVAGRRSRLLALAGSRGDEIELLEGEAATPAGVAAALATLTLALGRRVLIVDGAERWRAPEVEKALVPALAQLPADTTVAFFAREEARTKTPAALAKAVRAAGGQVAEEATVKPWELPKWVREQAGRLGVELDAAAAKALVAQVGARQQRLLRELEKLALALGPGRVREQDVESLAAHSADSRAFALADALLEADAPGAMGAYLRLRGQGEQLTGLLYVMAKRLRDGVAVAQMLERGDSVADIKKRLLPVSGRAADRLIAAARRSEQQRLKRALAALAELELASRGGSPLPGARGADSGLEEDTLALRAIAQITTAA